MDSQQQQHERSLFEMSEQGDSSSAEDVESPRSVVSAARRGGGGGRRNRWRKRSGGGAANQRENKGGCLHSQVLRIKEEELQIGEELVGGDCYYGDDSGYVARSHPLDDDHDHDRIVMWARTMLPASPLGGGGGRKSNNSPNK